MKRRWTLITKLMPEYCSHQAPAYYFGKNWHTRPTLSGWSCRDTDKSGRAVAPFGVAGDSCYEISIYKSRCYARQGNIVLGK